jgi:hypothetical protein
MTNITPSPAAEAETRTAEAAANAAADAPRAKPPGKKRIKADKPPRAGGNPGRAKAPSAKLSAVPENEKALSADAFTYLQERELVIEQGKSASIAMAVALYEIKNYDQADLLQGRYKSVADYAGHRFGLKRAYVSLLLAGGEVVVELRRMFATANKLPVNERQIRPLLKLEPKYRAEVWGDVVASRDSDQVTSGIVLERVRERAVELGLEWATQVAPEAESVTATKILSTAPSAPVETKTILQSPEPIPAVPPVESAPQRATASTAKKPDALSLDDEIRAAYEHLHSLVAKHRKAVEVTCLLEKLRKNLELE